MTMALLSLLMDFPGTNCISGPAVGTRRLVGSTLNELILDVRGSQLINYLQGQALSCAFLVSSSMARAQDPAIDQTQSQAKAFAQSTAWGLCQPRCPLPATATAGTVWGDRRGWLCWEQLPVLMDGPVPLPEPLTPHCLCSYGVFLFVRASITALSQHSSSPNCSTLSRIFKQIEMRWVSSFWVCAEKSISL